jgi:hypothetical protein
MDIRHDRKDILGIMFTKPIRTIELPTDKKDIHIRKPSKPLKEVQKIYRQLWLLRIPKQADHFQR